MNTGVQKSGSTPFGARTTTTPVGSARHGKEQAAKYLKKVIEWTSKDAILLFLANKMDLEEAADLKTIIADLDLSKIIVNRPHSFGIYQTSALEGTNVQEAWSWLAEKHAGK